MIVVENNSASAAYSLYNETEGIELTTCLMMTNYVEKLPIEMPMGMSERRFKKYLRKKTETYVQNQGVQVYNSAILSWFLLTAIQIAIKKLIEHWISKQGWV
jgi:hypothetical protein|tara:strand:- start:46 stop:351 length:306 start_codon:yes stop_codon:yes gene_type:complete